MSDSLEKTTAASLPGPEISQESRKTDLGLQLTASLRSGIRQEDLDLEKPPDGGVRAWLQVLGVHITIFTTWGFINSYGVFQTYYEASLEATPSAISWIGSIQIFLLFFLGTITGRSLDAGYFFAVYRTGSVLVLVGIFMTSLGTRYWHIFLSQGVCSGIANGLMFCPSLALCSTYFSRRRSMAIGAAASGSATGGIVIPVMVQSLLPRIGFAWTLRALGLVCFVLLGVSNLIMKPRLPPRKSGPLVEWSAFKELPYLFFAIGMFLEFWGIYFAFYYISSFARDRLLLSQSTSFNMLVIMNAVGLPGRVLPGYIADRRTGPLNIMLPIGIVVGGLFFAWTAVHSYGGLVAWACFYGIFAAGIQGLFPATLSSLTSDISKAGTRMGMIFSIVAFATLTGTPIGGALIQQQGGSYVGAQCFSGAVMVAGAVVLFFSRWAKLGLKMGRC